MKFEVTLVGEITVTPEYDGEKFDHDQLVEQAFDGMMRELLHLAGVDDPQVSGSITTGAIEVNVTVEAEDHASAMAFADPAIRSAFHAAGVGTAIWEHLPVELRVSCYRIEVDELVDA